MNAIELLEQQHNETFKMFSQLKDSKPGTTRKQIFTRLRSALLAHMVIEEELFYPTVALAQPEGEPIAEGYEEHAGARTALDRCARALGEDELFGVRIGVLIEMVKHHIEEERSAIFARARKAIPGDQLAKLGAEMQKRFAQAQKAPSPAAKLNRMATSRARQALTH